MKCKYCKKQFNKIGHNQKYCSLKCRNKSYRKYRTNWQRLKRAEEAKNREGKVQCLICGLWYVQVGSHVITAHGYSSAREYREDYNLEVKRGIVPKWYRKLKGELALNNKTYKNLKAGKKYWFKKGDKVGRYERSPITIERLKKLHLYNK